MKRLEKKFNSKFITTKHLCQYSTQDGSRKNSLESTPPMRKRFFLATLKIVFDETEQTKVPVSHYLTGVITQPKVRSSTQKQV